MKALPAGDVPAEDARTRIAVLGPVHVWCDGRETRIKGARPQALLTVLLLDANRVVTLQRLAELMWERPPASATANLRTYACRLRSALGNALGQADSRRLIATASGYRLQAAPEESDISVFTTRMRRGLELLTDDPRRAAGYLHSALGLWRGAAAENVPRTSGLAGRLAALEDQRHRATEALMQARLALGEHEKLVGELHELIAAHPTRERLWCQLIVATYRCGDPAAAIAAFEQARDVLRRELGIAPGPELADLRRQVLQRDPALRAPSRHGSRLAAPRPAPSRMRPGLASAPPEPPELPELPEPFVGRAGELAYVVERLATPAAHRLAMISGAAGTGKSAFAARVAHALHGLGHARCITLDLRGTAADRAPLTTAQALRRLRELRRVAGMPATLSPRSAAHPLTVLDNASSAEQVRPLIQALAPCPVLVTSRPVLAVSGPAIRLDLTPLRTADSRRLLAVLCGEQRAAAEPDQIDALVRLCCGLPLALYITGMRLAARPEWPIATFAEILADERCRLDELRGGGLAVRASFEASHRALTEGADAAGQRAALLFGRLGRERAALVDADQASDILGCDRVLAAAALGRLADARLAEPAGAGGYQITDLMRVFAAEQHEPEGRCAGRRHGGRGVDASCYPPPSLLRTTPSSRSVGR
ncbi:MAG TPA: AfsR/SARP family transcriptional regulator [Actinocrinis sp.]|nr:AfsR/SARP family transcriptional regulator [Actinocrinis sp.]